MLNLPSGVTLTQLDDPQHALSSGHTSAPGFHTVFANIKEGQCEWSMPVSFDVKEPARVAAVPQHAGRGEG